MTKVSLVVSDLSQSGAGRWGGGVRPFLLAQVLKKLNYEVEIIGCVFGNETVIHSTDGISVVGIKGQNYPGFFSTAQKVLTQINGDIIYAYKTRPTSLGISLIKKNITNRPLILDIDDWELSWYGGDRWEYHPPLKQLARDIFKSNGALRNPDHPIYLKWIEKLVSQADAVTVHTQFLQQRFGGTYLPNGKDTSVFDPSQYDPEVSRKRYNLSGYRVLMFPGAPRPYKGLEDILTALDCLAEPDLRLVIVGGSPYDDYDDKLIEKWGHWIIKLPTQPVQMMPEVLAAADIVVVPQRDRPATKAQFPLKLTDGMAMAKPILATRVGDIPEILADTGYLVDSESPEQLAEKIKWIFENIEIAKQQGLNARERCVLYYSFDAMADILSKVISQL